MDVLFFLALRARLEPANATVRRLFENLTGSSLNHDVSAFGSFFNIGFAFLQNSIPNVEDQMLTVSVCVFVP